MNIKQMKNEQISMQTHERQRKAQMQLDSTELQLDIKHSLFRLPMITNNNYPGCQSPSDQGYIADIKTQLEKRRDTGLVVLKIPKPVSFIRDQNHFLGQKERGESGNGRDMCRNDVNLLDKKIEQKSLDGKSSKKRSNRNGRKRQRQRIKKQRKEKGTAKRVCEERDISDEDFIIPEGHFHELRNLLKILFSGEQDYKNGFILNKEESLILNAIYFKKFQKELVLAGFIRNISHCQALMNKKQRKRCEEVYKFVFKTAFKYMKNAHFTDKGLYKRGISKEKRKNEFYQHYFGDLARKLGKPLKCFYLPLTPSNWRFESKAKLSKTINHSYITSIFQSKLFLSDFVKFVREKSISYSREIIIEKIDKLVDRWEDQYKELDFSSRKIETIVEDIKFNSKCCFPWSMGEVRYAFEEIQRLLPK